MAGHSKWANIQHRKNRQDERKGRAFGKLIKEITVAAKLGGDDVTTNPRLRLAIEKAKEANLPKDKVKDAINRGCGLLQGVTYDEMTYEGYGAGGVAFLINCLTDNRSRTVAEIDMLLANTKVILGQKAQYPTCLIIAARFFK